MTHGTATSVHRPDHVTRSIPSLVAAPAPTFSFEFFPPKDDAGAEALWAAIRRLEQVGPSFVSVTYGAGGATQERTVRMTERIAADTTLTPLGHLTCVGASVATLRNVVGLYAAAGVHNILALRGDPPGGLGTPWVAHPEGLNHAEQLVALIKELGDFTVGVAAFPDRHPESPSLERDAEILVRKADAGAEYAITQFVFDVDSYLRLRDRVGALGRDLPIVAALMPVTNIAQLKRMAELCGQPLPAAVVGRLEAVAEDKAAVVREGVAICTESAQRLLAEGAPGIHFITMNRSPATLEVFQNLGLAPLRPRAHPG
ncbi:MAG TPA: methylenetetrahydrofolate reductase [NAD(P)H] [Candidatus Lustribacter sp.]|nr:methylenetetrahydrofolate reductase [NAD(P)H] [Candidatus Lustribacter sp.]